MKAFQPFPWHLPVTSHWCCGPQHQTCPISLHLSSAILMPLVRGKPWKNVSELKAENGKQRKLNTQEASKRQGVCSDLELLNMKQVFSFLWTIDLGQNYVGRKQTLFQLVLIQYLEGGNSHSETPFLLFPCICLKDKQGTEVARNAGWRNKAAWFCVHVQ